MKVNVSLYASLASGLPQGGQGNTCIIDVEDGTSVRDLLGRFSIGADEPKIIFRNGIHAKPDDLVKDGDRIAVFPPIAGG